MKRITGLWEYLPDSGAKPVAVMYCERLERDIVRAQKHLQNLRHAQVPAYGLAIANILQDWTQKDLREARTKKD